ncbi:MAG: SpoIIE family protein phosphatase [Bacteroidales bacterium]|nr:SpoIIE family protein phosphatase [Bacteroidales bacterium]
MEDIRKTLRRFYSRQGLLLVLAAAVLLEANSLVQYYFARKGLHEEATRRAQSEMEKTRLSIQDVTNSVELSVKNLGWLVENMLDMPENFFSVMRQTMDANPYLTDAGVAFAPDYYPEKGRWYEPLVARRPDGSFEALQVGSESHDYFEKDWFRVSFETGEGHWSEPYYDESGGRTTVVTFTLPVRDPDGNIVAVCAGDVSLDWLEELIGNIRLYPNSFSTMVSRSGEVMISPAETLVTDDVVRFVEPIDKTGWKMSIVIPEREIYASVNRLGLIMTLLQLLGLVILGILLQRTARNQVRLEEVENKKEQIENELTIARGIQMAMLPKIFPPYPERDDISMFGMLTPAKQVGGDLYDFFIRDEKLFFCIGDVSGKGVPASLVMAVTRSLFRTISAHENDPAVIVQNMNDSMSETNETNMFVTFLAGVLDLTDGTLRYCNAGHNAPLIMSPHKTRFMDVVSNIPLGIVEGMFYQEQETKLAAGEGVFLYTDGLTEAENVRKELFGEDHLLSLAAETASSSVEEQVGRISQAVKDHMGTEPQSDDLTMLSFKYQGDPHTFRYQLKLRNNLSEIPKIETFVNEVASVAGIQDHLTTSSINLALEEAITNVIMYAYPSGIDGPVYLEAVISEGKATFILSDTGKPFDPTKAEEVDVTLAAEDRPIGGLGIHLVRTIMDNVSYEYLSGKNILMMTKNL